MAVAHKSVNQDGSLHGWLVSCPACGYPHLFDARWAFNGNVDKPSFMPSMLVNGNAHAHDPHMVRCHSYVTNGCIQYLGDCTHAMAGQTVDLPEFQW